VRSILAVMSFLCKCCLGPPDEYSEDTGDLASPAGRSKAQVAFETFKRLFNTMKREAKDRVLHPREQTFECICGLYSHSESPAEVVFRLSNLYEQKGGRAVRFYLPQLANFLINGQLTSPEKERIELFLLDRSERSVHWAHRLFFFMAAFSPRSVYGSELCGQSGDPTQSALLKAVEFQGAIAAARLSRTVAAISSAYPPRVIMLVGPDGKHPNGTENGSEAVRAGSVGDAARASAAAKELASAELAAAAFAASATNSDISFSGQADPSSSKEPTVPFSPSLRSEQASMLAPTSLSPVLAQAFDNRTQALFQRVRANLRTAASFSDTEGRSTQPLSALVAASALAPMNRDVYKSSSPAAESAPLPQTSRANRPLMTNIGSPGLTNMGPLMPAGGAASTLAMGGGGGLTSFRETCAILNEFCRLSSLMSHVPLARRNLTLRASLDAVAARYLPSMAAYVPIGNCHNRLVGLHSADSFCFKTAKRAPFLVVLEVVEWATASGYSLDKDDSDDDEVGRERSRKLRTEAEELESLQKREARRLRLARFRQDTLSGTLPSLRPSHAAVLISDLVAEGAIDAAETLSEAADGLKDKFKERAAAIGAMLERKGLGVPRLHPHAMPGNDFVGGELGSPKRVRGHSDVSGRDRIKSDASGGAEGVGSEFSSPARPLTRRQIAAISDGDYSSIGESANGSVSSKIESSSDKVEHDEDEATARVLLDGPKGGLKAGLVRILQSTRTSEASPGDRVDSENESAPMLETDSLLQTAALVGQEFSIKGQKALKETGRRIRKEVRSGIKSASKAAGVVRSRRLKEGLTDGGLSGIAGSSTGDSSLPEGEDDAEEEDEEDAETEAAAGSGAGTTRYEVMRLTRKAAKTIRKAIKKGTAEVIDQVFGDADEDEDEVQDASQQKGGKLDDIIVEKEEYAEISSGPPTSLNDPLASSNDTNTIQQHLQQPSSTVDAQAKLKEMGQWGQVSTSAAYNSTSAFPVSRATAVTVSDLDIELREGVPEFEEAEVDPDARAATSTPAIASEVVFPERWRDKEARLAINSPYSHQPGWRLIPIIVKADDDLRQEQFVSQLLAESAHILRQARVPVWLRPYEILATSLSAGLVQAVPDTISLDALKRADPFFTDLNSWFERHFGGADGTSSDRLRVAKMNFARSLAGYSVLCYILQIKDRHNGNILIDRRGHLLHIDFGFLLTNSPGNNLGFEAAGFKLDRDMLAVLGGPSSALFATFRKLCVRAFLALRAQRARLTLLVQMTLAGNESLPCFQGGARAVMGGLHSRFKEDADERTCVGFVNKLIDESVGNWRTAAYDQFQYFSQGVR
jgi:phosphatidylinositol 4-kinase B